jgi:hypothetical protein
LICPALGDPTGSNATAGLALRVTGTHKPLYHGKVKIPTRLPLFNTNKDVYIFITCLIGLTGEVSAGAELPPRNNPNDDKTSRHRASHATEPNGNNYLKVLFTPLLPNIQKGIAF